ncbi:Uncharacterized protein TPAR_07162 [Tolypocladium paradoxum]|uniref:Septum formation initiator domain-containing protein n=1 Tax=Tolypocladium paradoxum TaxID=94208 RepID=A0A2S4KR53_9HYPO|nr:Uncharacterized protein TPAR_07162 [Tolypocladium paradoxum]
MANLSNLVDLPKPARSTSPGGRHQVKRSLTEFTSPVKLHRHHHLHTHQLQHRHHRDHDDDDDTGPPTAYTLPLIRHSLDMPRSEATTPLLRLDQSRGASVPVSMDDDGKHETKESREARLRLEQEKASIRADGLKQSLVDLNTFSTDMTKRLDDTYYSVLEKMSTLQNIVMAMKDLADTSRELCETFDKASRDLESDITGQLIAVGRFDDQQTRISGLQSRIHEGRAKIQSLTSRVDVVRERIEGWERADRAWQERTRKRLKIIWSATSIVTILIIALAVGVNYSSTDLDGMDGDPSEAASLGWLNMSNQSRPSTEDGGETGRALLWKTPLTDGEQLRVFDEL